MNVRRLSSAMAIALLLSGLCTYLLSRKISANGTQHTRDRQYVAPAAALGAGEILKKESLEMVDWPAANPVEGAFVRPEDLVGRALLYPMVKGQPITDKYVTAVGAGLGLAGKIADGMRAVALRSDEVVGVGGFLVPGSHLDVLVTYRSERLTEPLTLTVLQDAIVLAAGHQVQPDPEGKPTVATVVTLLLTPNQAERAVLASTQGTIHFVMRGGADKRQIADPPVLLSELSGDVPAVGSRRPIDLAPVSHPLRSETPRIYVVDTILGDKQTTEIFTKPGPK